MIGEGEVGGVRTNYFPGNTRMMLVGRIVTMARSAGAGTPGAQCSMIDRVANRVGFERGWHDARADWEQAFLIGMMCVFHGRKF